jgi:plasmid maintenance system antidote protein VapI
MEQQEMVNIIWTSAKFATALGKYEGNVQFILEEQSRLTKEDILRILQDTYDRAEKDISEK